MLVQLSDAWHEKNVVDETGVVDADTRPLEKLQLGASTGRCDDRNPPGLAPVLGDLFPYLVYLPAVALAGSLCRLGSSILCLSLSAVAADYFFVPGRGVFLNADPASRVGLGLFIVTSIPIIVAFYWYHIKFDRLRGYDRSGTESRRK